MSFPDRDLTDQLIKASYKDVLQKYTSSVTSFVLDGLGEVFFAIPSASIGSVLITSDVTASMTVLSSSYSLSSSYEIVKEVSSSHADFADSASFLYGNGVVSQSLLFVTMSSLPWRQEGQVFWDYDAHTLALIPDFTGSTLQIGQEMWMRVIADENIPDGYAVYIHDAISGVPCVRLALADGTGTRDDVIGAATNTIASGSVGIITTMGEIHGLNTTAFSVGSLLYLSTTVPGWYQTTAPIDPYETVAVGHCISSDATEGIIAVAISNIGSKNYPFVGITNTPTMVSSSVTPSGSIITIGTGSVNLCESADGRGLVKNFTLNSASFDFTSSFLNVHYIAATYNSGSPSYVIYSDKDEIDDIQTTVVYTVVPAAGGRPSFAFWGDTGNLLSNKDNLRVQSLRGIERQNGLELAISDSTNRYFTIDGGTAWQGVYSSYLPPITSSVDRVVLVAHSASIWSGSVINSLTNTLCDNGTNVVALGGGANHWVANYVYRTIGTLNATLVMYSQDYTSVTDAIAGQPPNPPTEMMDTAFLVGRVIYKKNTVPAVRVDSAYNTILTPAGITVHNQLSDIQGGDGTNYYHLASSSYAQVIDGNLRLLPTTNDYEGIIWKSGSRFIHDFHQLTGSGFTPSGSNIFVGINAGNFTMGLEATLPYQASNNTSVGHNTLQSLTLGYNNTALGFNTLADTTTGYYNTAIGTSALRKNVTGIRNTAVGAYTLYQNLSGSNNTVVGYYALNSIITGSENIALGYNAGRYNVDGTANQCSSCSIYIGTDARSLTNNTIHEIVIGSHAMGLGSNTVLIGSSSITTTTSLWGNVGVQTGEPQATLDVKGNVLASSVTASVGLVIPVYGSEGAPTGEVKGAMAFNSSSNLLYIFDGVAWRSASFA